MSLINSIGRLAKLVNSSVRLELLRNTIRQHHNRFFTKYLLYTNITIATAASSLGDLIQQQYEIAAGYQSKWDRMRTMKLAFCGLLYGWTGHYWYIMLDRLFVVQTFKNLMKKIAIDLFIGSPLTILVFFISLKIWNGWSLKQTKDEILKYGIEIIKFDIVVWPIAQIINFKFLPLRYRLLYDCSITIFYDTYFSYVMHKDLRENNSKIDLNLVDIKETLK